MFPAMRSIGKFYGQALQSSAGTTEFKKVKGTGGEFRERYLVSEKTRTASPAGIVKVAGRTVANETS